MDKKQMSETDICMKYINPAIEKAGWDIDKQVRREVSFTDGKIIVYGKTVKRGKRKRADYILYYKNDLPLAIIEAKDNKHSIGDGMQQAIEYSEILDLPFVFTSNGDGFIFHDKEDGGENELTLNEFPSPEKLWDRYKQIKSITKEDEENMITSNYYYDSDTDKRPRYYQRIAINRTVEAVAKGQDRVLLVMATGTGKTFTAFQIIHRLRESWRPNGKKPRVLYLADRNILIDQTMINDFKPFSKVMTKVKKRTSDKAFEVYMALYQGLSGTEDWKNIYKQFSKDFFDLIIVDECHRGSAREDSAWREILEYFNSSTQIGLTATPKETKDISNIDYFGKPIYTYSLKQGIEDGFLAPYRVLKVLTNKDALGYRPPKGKRDRINDAEIPDGIYSSKDFDRTLVIDERTELVAKRISDYLKNTDRYAKTIVFCVDIDHAERIRRALVNENKDLVKKNPKYVMKITGDDKEGKAQLDNFIDPASKYPVIATTSKLMTTGVDAQTCKLIVLDANIQSMTEFKQIIGRGTRIKEEYGKHYFTIMDFRKATNLFADPDFDGDPVQSIIYTGGGVKDPEGKNDKELQEGERIIESPDITIKEGDNEVRKYYINGEDVNIINEQIQYHDSRGKLITEKLTDYTKKGITKEYRTLNDFISKWNIIDQKRALIDELEEQGILFDALKEEVGGEYDPFDLILHVAYGQKPISRKERAKKVKDDSYFNKYGQKARKVIEALLDKYSNEGIENLEDTKILQVNPINQFGRPLEIMKLFGGKLEYQKMIKEVEERLYVMPKMEAK